MKKLAALLTACALLLCALASCGAGERLELTSLDYPELKYLKKGELSAEVWSEWVSLDNPYGDFELKLSVENGKLVASDEGANDSHIAAFDNGYFVGVDLGEFDGWVEYRPYHNGHANEGEAVKIIGENCRKIISLDKRNGYLLTSDAFDEEKSTVRRLKCENSAWTWDVLAELDGYIHDGFYNESDGSLYLLTTAGVYKLDGAGNKTRLFDNECFDAFWNSIVVLDGKVYCSFAPGVLCYDMTTAEQTFYEMDYAGYVK